MPSLTKIERLSEQLKSLGTERPLHGSRVNHSQFAKKVFLRLYTNGRIDGNLNANQQFIFPINPEEFVLSRPERVHVVQTLGEPFVDEYGKGVATLTIRGTTGWRIRPTVENIDGHEAFRLLHRNFIDRYFEERENKLNSGLDPDDINLVIINGVDELCYKVIPENFKLLRNRTKPLLYQYELAFVVLKDLNAIDVGHSSKGLIPAAESKNWMAALTERVEPLINAVKQFATPICNQVGDYIRDSVDVLKNAKSGVGDVANFLNGVSTGIKLALDATRDTQQFINKLPLEAILELNTLTSVIGEVNCYLQKGVTESWLPDFSGIQGVSDCATTHGIKPGAVVAPGVGNAIEWVVNLNESARLNGSAALIGIRHNEDHLANMFEEPRSAIIMESTLDSKLAELRQIRQSPAVAGDLDGVYGAISNLLADLDIDASRLPDDPVTDSLQRIDQFKIITVKDGDTLQSIAFKEYGDATRWAEIAAANDIVIEIAAEMLAPMTSYTVGVDLYRSDSKVDLGFPVPTNYAVPGCVLILKDQQGRRQRLRVKSVSGSVISFHETFSQTFVAPVTFTRMVDLADYGVFDTEVELTSAFNSGQRVMEVSEVKDIYPGYNLYIVGAGESRPYTVQSVNYLEKKVTVTKPSLGFAAVSLVRVFNKETHQMHLVPGRQLKIPVVSGDKPAFIQSVNEVFGCDVATDASGLIKVLNGDLAVVSGLDNLKQAVEHRVLSNYESLLIHPQYGCGLLAILGDKNTPAVQALAKAAIVDALNREPRLDRIAKLNAFSVGDAIKFSIQVESVESNTVTDLNFVIGGIS